jgi:hypothetical protein
MRTVLKYAAAVALTGALALAAATPSQARHGRNAALIGGFAAGAVVGAAVASGGYYGGPGYYYGPGPAYYGPGPYAYEQAPVYVAPTPVYRRGGCWHETDSSRGFGYYGAC